MNRQPFTLEPLPRKVENFIKRRDQAIRERINAAFEYITHSPFHHENPTTIRRLRGRTKERYRYWFQIRHQRQTGEVRIQSFTASFSKSIIDDIDHVLAQHYGFTDEELDFIINYDIKYRMGLGK